MMIRCSYQVSQLMISKGGYTKLHAHRSEVPLKDAMVCDFFNFPSKKGLSIYWGCEIRIKPLSKIKLKGEGIWEN